MLTLHFCDWNVLDCQSPRAAAADPRTVALTAEARFLSGGWKVSSECPRPGKSALLAHRRSPWCPRVSVSSHKDAHPVLWGPYVGLRLCVLSLFLINPNFLAQFN